jgi:NADH:ubiquinone oxidoreductase subunit 6 (subunit J)
MTTGGFGVALFLIGLGAILRYAVVWEPAGVDIGTVGLILMIIGAVMFLLTIVLMLTQRRPPGSAPPPPPPPPTRY